MCQLFRNKVELVTLRKPHFGKRISYMTLQLLLLCYYLAINHTTSLFTVDTAFMDTHHIPVDVYCGL